MVAPAKDGAMDLVDLRYLSIAVETGSLSRAAQSLGVKPSTISRRITRLEDELGVTIFERGAFRHSPDGSRPRGHGQGQANSRSLDSVLQAGKSSGRGKDRPRSTGRPDAARRQAAAVFAGGLA